MGADQIDWDEDTFQVIIDGVRKNNSSLVDILTFLEDEEPIGNKMFVTSHTTGDFHGEWSQSYRLSNLSKSRCS